MSVMDPKFEIVLSDTIQRIDDAKQLFLEYAKSLNFSLCFQEFDKELAGLPGEYSPPSGRFIVKDETRVPTLTPAIKGRRCS